MKRRFLAAVLSLAVCLGLCMTVAAEEQVVDLVGFVPDWTAEDGEGETGTREWREGEERAPYLRLEAGELQYVGTFLNLWGFDTTYPVYASDGPVTVTLLGGWTKEEIAEFEVEEYGIDAVGGPAAIEVHEVTYSAADPRVQLVKKNAAFFTGTAYKCLEGTQCSIEEYMSGPQDDYFGFGVSIETGAYVTLSEPGTYLIRTWEAMSAGDCEVVLIIGGGSTLTATPTSSTVLVNGQQVSFDAYNIGGANYFKLRDLAYVLNGTQKQFEVSWDGAANCISLTSGQAYTAVGGEMGAQGGGAQTATPTTSKIVKDGAEVSFTAYNINGANYFKLRDIGAAFDFGVDWDQATQTISIDTTKGYTAG